jgi:hypothetical protein
MYKWQIDKFSKDDIEWWYQEFETPIGHKQWLGSECAGFGMMLVFEALYKLFCLGGTACLNLGPQMIAFKRWSVGALEYREDLVHSPAVFNHSYCVLGVLFPFRS